MTLRELMELIAQSYPDDIIRTHFDDESGRPKKGLGDGLAGFIVEEVYETFDTDDPIGTAIEVLERAADDLQAVLTALYSAQGNEVLEGEVDE